MAAAASAGEENVGENWHTLTAREALARQRVDPQTGLSEDEIATRLGRYGPNRLPTANQRGPLLRFLSQFDNVLIYILVVAAFIKLFIGLWLDASIVFGVVLLNSVLGFLQEGKAEKALDSIRGLLSAEARVRRGGRMQIIPAEELAPGDIVLLESGDRVPADLRLVDVRNLRTEEAALTGESLAADKSADVVAENATIGDRDNMAFSGTLVVSGRAEGVVVATGAETEIGRINKMLSQVSALETPLLRQIREFGHWVAIVIGIVSILMFAYGRWVQHMPFVTLFQAVVSMAVSAIPEGLPALITITLGIGVQRMAERRAIIRRLPAVETLGSVSRICSDKTGTLTLMEMMASSAVTADGSYEITGAGYDDVGELRRDGARVESVAPLQSMGLVSVLCNDSDLHRDGETWTATGDPTEAALYPFAAKVGVDRSAHRAAYPRKDMIPFESDIKFMATLHAAPDGSRLLLMKGAPEVVIDHCKVQSNADAEAPLDAQYWHDAAIRLAGRGARVLALALKRDAAICGVLTPETMPTDLTLLGLVGMIDPPRQEAVDAIRECHEGGIRVTMITGDHKVTAAAIGKMLDIGDGVTAVTGVEIEAMTDAQLRKRVRDVDIFARASPEHKLRLVEAMQANGQIVAMTGDGVNDAPALKKADIGVAMGIKGTEVTKESAEMVLMDDNFASITAAVKEGRTVYNNIEKSLRFMLPTNVAQGLVILAAVVFGFTLPITAPQILWINMVTSAALGLILSFEPHSDDVMRRPPRKIDKPILDGFGVWRMVFIGLGLLALTLGAFFFMKWKGASINLARTAAVNQLAIGQIFYLFNSRHKIASSLSFSAQPANAILPIGVGATILLQLAFTYAPPLQRIFATEFLPLVDWTWLVGGGLVFFLIVEAEKFVLRLIGRGGGAAQERAQQLSAIWALPAVGALAAVVIAGAYWTYLQENVARYQTAPVSRGEVARVVDASGRVAVSSDAPLFALAPGIIEKSLCAVGERVAAGQLCAVIDRQQMDAAARQSENAARAADERLAGAQATLARTKESFTRDETQFKARRLSRAVFARSQQRLARAENAVARAKIEQDARHAERERAATALAHRDIRTPVAGVVKESAAKAGAVVRPNEALFVIAPTDTVIRVTAKIDDAELRAIKLGANVDFSFDDEPHTLLQGFVEQLGNVARDSSHDYNLVLTATSTAPVRKPESVALRIFVDHVSNAMRVPLAARSFSETREIVGDIEREGAPQGWSRLWLLRGGQPESVAVQYGVADHTHVEILNGDLSPDDRVIIAEKR